LRIDLIKDAVYRQLSERNHLLDAEKLTARRDAQGKRQRTGHDIGRGECFTGMGQQGFGIDFGEDGEDCAGLTDGLGVFFSLGQQVVIERAQRCVVELERIEEGVGGYGVGWSFKGGFGFGFGGIGGCRRLVGS
jgi:hypothetical protein